MNQVYCCWVRSGVEESICPLRSSVVRYAVAWKNRNALSGLLCWEMLGKKHLKKKELCEVREGRRMQWLSMMKCGTIVAMI